MATSKVKLPPGFELDGPVLPEGFQIDSSVAPQESKSLMGLGKNYVSDVVNQVKGNAELGAYAFPPLAAMKAAQGENIYSPERLKMIGIALLENAKKTPGRIKEEILHPIESGYKAPLTTGLDLATVASLAANAAAPLRKFAFPQMEQMSGLAPKNAGVLEAAFNDPSLMIAKGPKSASPLYEAAKDINPVSPNAKIPPKIQKIIGDSINKLNNGELRPIEALKARKAVDAVMSSKQFAKDDLIPLRENFDKVAKTDLNIAAGDQAYTRGVKGEALRNLLPRNIKGTASSMKAGIGGLIAAKIPVVGPIAAATALSPAVQGTIAATSGLAAKALAPAIENVGKLSAASAASSVTKNIPKTEQKQMEPITKEKAYEFVREAKGNKKKARRLAKNAGYTWEGDF